MKALLKVMCMLLVGCSLATHADELFSNMDSGYSAQLFRIDGSNTIGAELAPKLVENWMKARDVHEITLQQGQQPNEVRVTGYHIKAAKNVYVDIYAHGSSTGFAALNSEVGNIAAASRPIKESEIALLSKDNMLSVEREHIIGIDGLAVIIHPDNPIHSLTVDQIRDIFSGKYTDWSQVGIGFGAIKLYARDENSGTWDSFKSMVLGKTPLAESAQRFESNNELSDLVTNTSGAIGFVGLSSVRDAKLVAVSAGTAPAMTPSKLTVATEDYALSRRLFMYTTSRSQNAFVSDFMSYVRDQGQEWVTDVGFVSQDVQAMIPENYGLLPPSIQKQTQGAYRLSVNFRFHGNSAQLDNKSLRDVERLVGYLKANPDSDLMLLGFADENGNSSFVQLLSKHRAMAVGRELRKYEVYPGLIEGFGAASPVADVADAQGRNKNSRVEVWVRPSKQLVSEE